MLDPQKINDLVEKAQAGDAVSFGKVVELHYDMIYRIAFKWCGHREDAQDIAQDVCIKLARNIQKFAFKSAFSSWLYRVTLNVLRDYKRKDRNAQNMANIEDFDVQSKDASPEKAIYHKQVMGAVNDLPLKERAAILLVASEGLTHKQAADVLGCKESTVSWYIHEGRKKLVLVLNKSDENMADSNVKKGGQNHG